jgi:hypothetical protein
VPIDEAPSEFRVRDVPGGIEVDLSSPRRPLTALIVGAWLAGWAVGLAFLAQQFRAGESAGADVVFLVAWSTIWLAAGPLAFAYLVWLVVGRERVEVRERAVRIWRGVWRLGVSREYALDEVHDLRTFGRDVVPLLAAGLDFAGQGASGVRFQIGSRVVRFARALDEPAAHALVECLLTSGAFGARTRAPAEPAA